LKTRLHRHFIPFAVATLLFFVLAACASPRQALQDPTFRLVGVEPVALGVLEQQFRLTIRVDNPNDQALPVRSVRYKLQLAEVDFASGLTSNGFTLPARDSTTFDVEVSTDLLTSLPKLLHLLDARTEAVSYALSGDVEYGRFIRGSRSFEQTGELRLTAP